MADSSHSWDEREHTWRVWMVAAQAGDGDAYEKLLLELLPHARRQIGRRISDAPGREDIVQNAFVAIHRSRHTYRAERPFTPWFHAIVRNAITDWARARARLSAREVSLEIEGVPQPSVAPAEPFADSLSPEMARALAALPPAQREAVEMIHVEGLSVAEAAARAGVSAGALKVRAHRGYRALRAALRERDE
jgi:RNA polymerase sigma-70 factor (ECF subfamily)